MKCSDIAALALIVLSMLRIASTWTIFSATVDEPMHVSAGLELYTQHRHTYLPANPPLPRLVFALAPWLGGMDFDPRHTVNEQLQRVFYSDGRYETNLVLARSGNLVFFLIASLAVWWWARRELGATGGLVATLLFALQPMIAGHAGLATHDTAAVAAPQSALAFARWLDDRTIEARRVVRCRVRICGALQVLLHRLRARGVSGDVHRAARCSMADARPHFSLRW